MLTQPKKNVQANEITKKLMIKFKMRTEFTNVKFLTQDELNYRALSKVFAAYIQTYSHNYISLSEDLGGTPEDMKFVLSNLHRDFNKNILLSFLKRIAITDSDFNNPEMSDFLKKVAS